VHKLDIAGVIVDARGENSIIINHHYRENAKETALRQMPVMPMQDIWHGAKGAHKRFADFEKKISPGIVELMDRTEEKYGPEGALALLGHIAVYSQERADKYFLPVTKACAHTGWNTWKDLAEDSEKLVQFGDDNELLDYIDETHHKKWVMAYNASQGKSMQAAESVFHIRINEKTSQKVLQAMYKVCDAVWEKGPIRRDITFLISKGLPEFCCVGLVWSADFPFVSGKTGFKGTTPLEISFKERFSTEMEQWKKNVRLFPEWDGLYSGFKVKV
jgi:hypothetical protein